MALGYWYWTTDWLQNFITFLFVLIIPVWNLDSVTLLFVNILAVLLHYLPALLPGHIFTLGVRYLLTYLSRFIPAFLTWLIPTLLLSIHINNAFSFSNSGAHLLSHCITHFIGSFVTLLVIYSLALLFLNRSTFLLGNSFTLLFISMLGHLLLDNLAVHVGNIMTLFFMLQITLVLSYIVSLGFSSSLTNFLIFCVAILLILSLTFLGVFSVTFLFVFSVTFFLIFSFTLLLRHFLTLLLWNRLSPGNLNSMALFSRLVVHLGVPHSATLLFMLSGALFFIGSYFMWYLNSVTLLSRFIPALVFPDCSAGRNNAVSASNQKQESQYPM